MTITTLETKTLHDPWLVNTLTEYEIVMLRSIVTQDLLGTERSRFIVDALFLLTRANQLLTWERKLEMMKELRRLVQDTKRKQEIYVQ